MVGVGGPSSSGKLTVARALHRVLPASTVVHLDDFYKDDLQIPVDPTLNMANWDLPAAIEWGKFRDYINAVKATGGAALPMALLEMAPDMALTDSEVRALRALCPALAGYHVVLVDGFLLYHDAAIAGLFDRKLFFRAPRLVLQQRRELRAGYNTAEGFWVDPPNYFAQLVWPEYVRLHQHMFVDGDVEGELAAECVALGVRDIVNDGVPLERLVRWALGVISEGID